MWYKLPTKILSVLLTQTHTTMIKHLPNSYIPPWWFYTLVPSTPDTDEHIQQPPNVLVCHTSTRKHHGTHTTHVADLSVRAATVSVWYEKTSKQACTHMCNVLPLVKGLLRLSYINQVLYTIDNKGTIIIYGSMWSNLKSWLVLCCLTKLWCY